MVSNSLTTQSDKPRLDFIGAYLAFLLAIIYVPYISGAPTSPRWAFASVTFPLCLIGLIWLYREIRFTLVHFIGLLFIIYAGWSISWTYNNQAIYELIKLLILAEAFILGAFLTSLKSIFKGLGLGIIASNFLILFGMKGGLFINVNTLAETAVIVLIGLCVYRLWWYIPFILPSIILNGSRNAVFTLGVMFSFWCWSKSKIITVCLLSLITVAIILLTYYYNDDKVDSTYYRIKIWKDILEHVTWFGWGLNSFSMYSLYNIYTKPMFAHNDLLQILFELGIIGAILAIAFFTLVMRTQRNERYIVGSFIVISIFDFPFHLPVSACVALFVCGYLAWNRSDIFIFTSSS